MGGGVGGESTGCKTETYVAFWTIHWLVNSSILYVLDQKKRFPVRVAKDLARQDISGILYGTSS